ncbi:MAG TPA: histidine phosphatase family protein [Rhodopila sp.]|nr:histidine phosphatase family protein [Rhodopila sp.]
MTLSLYLVRHGQTEWSLSGQHTGRSDIPLTAQGEYEARAPAPWLDGITFDRVFTSPRQRAQRTCVLTGFGVKAEIEPDLVDWDYGDYEGMRSAAIHSQRPQRTIFQDGCSGDEMPADIATRPDRLIARLKQMQGQDRTVLSWAFRDRAGGAMDRAAGDRGAASLAFHGLRQCPRLHFFPSGRPGNRSVERNARTAGLAASLSNG